MPSQHAWAFELFQSSSRLSKGVIESPVTDIVKCNWPSSVEPGINPGLAV